MPSFDSVNYLLRPNKNIERKLFIEMLVKLGASLDLSSYRYVGLGSMWFVDFALVHRLLGLTNLVSIEKHAPERARFNRPFNCVHVEGGESSIVLPELGLGSSPSIIWMDYDSDLWGPAIADIEILSQEVAPRTVCMVTVNADVRQVRDRKDPEGTKMDSLEALEFVAGDLVPIGLDVGGITRASFPDIVSAVLINAFEHSVRLASRGMHFQLLANFAYGDGANMVTVCGIVLDGSDEPVDPAELRRLPFWPPSRIPYHINAPLLTLREKAALDQMMPGNGPISEDVVKESMGFVMTRDQIDAYQRFYRHYPIFAEYDI